MTNLFIAIVLDNFGFVTSVEEGDISLEDVNRFISTWKNFDSENKGFIPIDTLPRLLRNLRPPFGVGLEATPKDTLEFIAELQIKLHRRNQIRFPDLLLALSQKAIGIETYALLGFIIQQQLGPPTNQPTFAHLFVYFSIPSHVYETASTKISTRWYQYQRKAKLLQGNRTTEDSSAAVAHNRPVIEVVACSIIQREWRKYAARKKSGTLPAGNETAGAKAFAGLVRSLVASQRDERAKMIEKQGDDDDDKDDVTK